VQRVAIRVWRALPSFRGDCPVIAWIMTIVRGEIARVISRLSVERSRNQPIEAAGPIPAPPPAGSERVPARALVQDAAAGGVISSNEAAALLARMDMPEASWEQIGEMLGVEASTCASNHCRAIPRLRVYIFVCRQEHLGGREAIERAFELCQKGTPALTPEEAGAFTGFVLGGKPLREALRKPALRSACEKIIRRIRL
jgi:DNA-directed RNA polymerase specialized sigma24 family protein